MAWITDYVKWSFKFYNAVWIIHIQKIDFDHKFCSAGRISELRDKDNAHELYMQVKSEVEKCLAFLQEKRESDPYRNLLARLAYQSTHGFDSEVPTFELWFFCSLHMHFDMILKLDSQISSAKWHTGASRYDPNHCCTLQLINK